jgi:hypothetical protein
VTERVTTGRRTGLSLVPEELAASSSRSQVHRSFVQAYPFAGLPRPSMDVRGCSCMDTAIVTQLVTE